MRDDILDEHARDAAFLYRRLRRSQRILDGNAAQTRSLAARIAAHLDALSLFAPAARALLPPPEGAMDLGERFVSASLANAAEDGLAELSGCTLDREAHVALREALARGSVGTQRAVEAWLAEGSDSARALGVALLSRWGDPRAMKVASRAAARAEGALRASAVCVLAWQRAPLAVGAVEEALTGCEDPGWRDALLYACARNAPGVAVEVARRWEGDAFDTRWVLLGMTGDADDQSRLLDAFTMLGARGALPAALAMAGAHGALDDAWEGASLAASNALREAAYVVLGGEAPPTVVRDDMPEEPEDIAQRAREDVGYRARMAAAPRGQWHWGSVAGPGVLEARAGELGRRPRRWCRVGLAAERGV